MEFDLSPLSERINNAPTHATRSSPISKQVIRINQYQGPERPISFCATRR